MINILKVITYLFFYLLVVITAFLQFRRIAHDFNYNLNEYILTNNAILYINMTQFGIIPQNIKTRIIYRNCMFIFLFLNVNIFKVLQGSTQNRDF